MTPVVQQELDRGSGGDECVRPDMEGLVCICLPTHEPHSQDLDQGQRGGGRGDRVGSPLAQEGLVPPSPPNGHGATGDVPQADGSALADPVPAGRPIPPRPGVAAIDCLETERSTWQSAGFSQKVISTAMAAKRDSTRKVYDGKWGAYVKWCNDHELQPVQAPLTQVLEFLQSRADAGLAVSTIRGYLTVISAKHEKISEGGIDKSLVDLAPVQTWIKGLVL